MKEKFTPKYITTTEMSIKIADVSRRRFLSLPSPVQVTFFYDARQLEVKSDKS